MPKTVCFKFCGGCNPFYNRGEFRKKLLSNTFANFSETKNTSADILIILNGCNRCCVKSEQFTEFKNSKIFVLTTDDEDVFEM